MGGAAGATATATATATGAVTTSILGNSGARSTDKLKGQKSTDGRPTAGDPGVSPHVNDTDDIMKKMREMRERKAKVNRLATLTITSYELYYEECCDCDVLVLTMARLL